MRVSVFFRVSGILIILGTAVLTGCATTPALSPMQRRAIQTRTFENASYDTVFRAFKTVLQDEGYIIKNQDMTGGLIVATIEHTDRSGAFFAALSGQHQYRTSEAFEVSVNLEEVSKTIVESRMTIQKIDTYNLGGRQGDLILTPGIYKSFYDKVIIEVERRKAKGRQ